MQIEPTRLVAARLARNMSQEEVAIAADLSARTIQRIEAGHSASLESTKALLTTFGADILHDPLAEAGAILRSPWAIVAAQTGRASRTAASVGFAGLRLLLALQFLIVALPNHLCRTKPGCSFAATILRSACSTTFHKVRKNCSAIGLSH